MSDLESETPRQLIARIAVLTSKLEIARSLLQNLEEMFRILEEEGIPAAEAEAVVAERVRVAASSEPWTPTAATTQYRL